MISSVGGAGVLAKLLVAPGTTITCLNLTNCGLGDHTCVELCSGLGRQKCSLMELSLASNYITDTGARALSGAILSSNLSLAKLDCSDWGSLSLPIAGIAASSSLTQLRLRNNQLTAHLGPCLAENSRSVAKREAELRI